MNFRENLERNGYLWTLTPDFFFLIWGGILKGYEIKTDSSSYLKIKIKN